MFLGWVSKILGTENADKKHEHMRWDLINLEVTVVIPIASKCSALEGAGANQLSFRQTGCCRPEETQKKDRLLRSNGPSVPPERGEPHLDAALAPPV